MFEKEKFLTDSNVPKRTITLLVAGVFVLIATCAISRLLTGSAADNTLAEVLAWLATTTASGPVIALGLATAAAIVAATVIPYITFRVITQRKERHD